MLETFPNEMRTLAWVEERYNAYDPIHFHLPGG